MPLEADNITPLPIPRQLFNHEERLLELEKGGDGGGDMEARVAKLEASVEHIQTDISDIKIDIREIRQLFSQDFKSIRQEFGQDFKSINENFASFRIDMIKWFIGTSIGIVAVLMGFIALVK